MTSRAKSKIEEPNSRGGGCGVEWCQVAQGEVRTLLLRVCGRFALEIRWSLPVGAEQAFALGALA